jgi:hypothetical protein
MEKIFTEQVLESFEDKIKEHHQLYPNIPVNAQYWESIASQSLNVVGWVVNNHNPNEDFNTEIKGLLNPSLKAGIWNGDVLKFSSHRMSKFNELSQMVNFLDTRDYDSYLFLSRKKNKSFGYHYLVCYMKSKKWKYSELVWTPIFGVRKNTQGKQQGWKGEGLDGKLTVTINFKMSNQLWVEVDTNLITIVKEIFI